MDNALAGQEKAMTGMLTGAVELTSGELSSLAVGLVETYAPGLPIKDVMLCMSPDGIYKKAVMADGTTVEVAADAAIVDNRMVVDLQAMAVNGQALPESMLTAIEGAYNRAFDDPNLGVAGEIEFGDDVMMFSAGQ